MFIVAIAGEKQLFLNSKTDDFLRGLAAQFDVEENEIEAWYITEEHQKQIRRAMKLNPLVNFVFDFNRNVLTSVVEPTHKPGQVNPAYVVGNEDGVQEILTAEDDACKFKITDVVAFNAIKVKEMRYKQEKNSITGELVPVVDEMILEDEAIEQTEGV